MFFPDKIIMKDKIVIITGASSGIGKALAHEFASRGAKLVLGARRIELLKQLEKELSPTEVLIQQTDVSKEEDCQNLIKQAISRFGKIDILINNAGISMRAIFEDMELDVIRNLMNVNFWGTVYCTKVCLTSHSKNERIYCWSYFNCRLCRSAWQNGLFGF